MSTQIDDLPARKETCYSDSRQSPTAPSSFGSRLQSRHDETPEVVSRLRRLIAEQNATLDERRRRIEATERQIDEYERRIHDDRCAQNGHDYLRRAYNLPSYDDDDDDDLVNQRRQIATNHTIAGYYRRASSEIRHRLASVEARLVDLANTCRKIASADCYDAEQHRQRVNKFDRNECSDTDRQVRPVVHGSVGRRLRAFQPEALEALPSELSRADDIRRQQLAEHDRLSRAVAAAQSQLIEEEARLTSMLAAHSDGPPVISSLSFISSDIRELRQPLKPESKKVQSNEYQLHLENVQQLAGRSDADDQVSVSIANHSVPDLTPIYGSERSITDDEYIKRSSSEMYAYSDISVSDSALESAEGDSLPDDDDQFIDKHRLVTLV